MGFFVVGVLNVNSIIIVNFVVKIFYKRRKLKGFSLGSVVFKDKFFIEG